MFQEVWTSEIDGRIWTAASSHGGSIKFSKLGDPNMAAVDRCVEAKRETPIQEEISHLNYQISQYLETQARTQELLRIARAKLAAVKALGK